MNKETSIEKLKELKFRISSLEKERQFDIEQLVKEKVEPLLEQAEKVRLNINSLIRDKYKDILSELCKEKNQIETIVDNFKIGEADSLWYAKGTIVYLWETQRFWGKKEKQYRNTGLKGIVDIYDGTQEMPSIASFRLPKKGDIIVRHLKKNGSVGLRFDLISDYNGELRNYFPNWCSDGDTPTNNPFTRKRKQDEED